MNRYLNLILMAAGNSERYGANKLLAFIQGKPMYRHIFDHLVRYQDEHAENCRVTVVSQYDEILEAAVEAGLEAVRNPRPEDGISLTIRLGIEAGQKKLHKLTAGDKIPDDPDREGAVFFTADQPFIRYETLESYLQSAHRIETGILAAAHDGISGNPVSFDQAYYPELLELSGDVGGKRVMNRHPDDVSFFEMEPLELVDIDRPMEENKVWKTKRT